MPCSVPVFLCVFESFAVGFVCLFIASEEMPAVKRQRYRVVHDTNEVSSKRDVVYSFIYVIVVSCICSLIWFSY